MSDYTKTTNFAAKDTLPSGNAAKVVKGTEIDTEFNNIATAIATKADGTTAINTTTTFGGDVSGTYNAIVIADDSHNHTIANVDGLQTALDAKLATTGTAADSDKVDGFHISTASSGTDANTIYFRTIT
jgi:hypothetical protein